MHVPSLLQQPTPPPTTVMKRSHLVPRSERNAMEISEKY